MRSDITARPWTASQAGEAACFASMNEGVVPTSAWVKPAAQCSGSLGRRWRSTELCETGISREDAVRVTRERTDGLGNGEFVSFGDFDADAARLFLTDTPASLIIEDGQSQALGPRRALHTNIRNLRPSLHWRADHALDLLSFVIPRAAVERWSEDVGLRTPEGLHRLSDAPTSDEVIAGFGRAILPCLDRPEVAPRLFVDQALHTVCTYLIRTFGGSRQPPEHKGGLAPWQERRAKEMIAANLDNQLSLQALAAECRLSISHFTKAFKKTLGQSPHQWLLERRVEHARTLLMTTHLPLSEVANTCGFSDQSHFSRTFVKHAGWSPGAWRRAHADSVI